MAITVSEMHSNVVSRDRPVDMASGGVMDLDGGEASDANVVEHLVAKLKITKDWPASTEDCDVYALLADRVGEAVARGVTGRDVTRLLAAAEELVRARARAAWGAWRRARRARGARRAAGRRASTCGCAPARVRT